MNFTAQSIWQLSKLFVRDPGAAVRKVLLANLPLNASVLLIVLSATVNGLLFGAFFVLFEVQIIAAAAQNGAAVTGQQLSPLLAGLDAMITALVFGYMLFWLGVRLKGTGTLEQVMSAYAALQIVICLLSVVFIAAFLVIVPLIPALAALFLFATIFIVIISMRGLGHVVKEAHQFPSMGPAIAVILGALLATFVIGNIVSILISPLLSGAA